MAGRNMKPGSGGFDCPDKVNSNTLKRHPKMDLSRTDLLQLLSYLEGELQARDITIATLKAEKAKQLLYQAKYGRFGLGDPFSAMQRDSDNLKDNTFDESAIKSMYDNQLAQLENLIATQRKAQMKMREQMIAGEKRYQKVCTELDEEKRKHAQDTAQGDDVTYMLEKERERLKQEVDFEKANTKKMEKDLKKTLANLEEERASSAKHKQVALMLIKERKKLVEKFMMEKKKADQYEKALSEERTKSMNMAEGLVQESKKSLKMEATMERQLSEFDLEREQMRNKLQREENRTKDLQGQLEVLRNHLETLQVQGKIPKEAVHSVEIKSSVGLPQGRSSSERTQVWSSGSSSSNISSNTLTGKSGQLKSYGDSGVVEHEAGLSPRNNTAESGARKRDNTRYSSPQPVERGVLQFSDNSLEQRMAPVGAVSDKSLNDPHGGQKLNVTMTGSPSVVSGGGRITVQTASPTPISGPVSPRRGGSVGRGVPPPIPPNKPVLPVATITKPGPTQKVGSAVTKDSRLSQPGTKSVHIPVSVVHTSTVSTTAGSRTPKREGSPTTIRKPAQFSDCAASTESLPDTAPTPPTPDSFDFLGPEMADLQQLLVSMVTGTSDSSSVEKSCVSESSVISSLPSSSFTSTITVVSPKPSTTGPSPSRIPVVSSLQSSTPSSLPTLTPIGASPTVIQTSVSVSALNSRSTLFGTGGTSQGLFQDLSKSIGTGGTSQGLFQDLSKNIGTAGTSKGLYQDLSLNIGTGSSSQGLFQDLPVNKSAPVFSSKFTSVSSATDSSHLPSSFSPLLRKMSPKTSPVKDMPTSPIHRYAASGDVESLRKLIIDLEADVNLPMKDGTSPTHCAAENGQTECLKLLIEKGCNVNCLRDDQMSPVHCASAEGHTGCLSLLLRHGGNVHLTDYSSWTPLHWAASRGHPECCKLLLSCGAKQSAISNNNATPCHLAVHSGSAPCLSVLLSHSSDQSGGQVVDNGSYIRDKDGWTIAHLAACREDTECLSLILNHCDIDLNSREKLGRTVLDVSSANCHQLLIPYVTRERLKSVTIEISCMGMAFSTPQPYVIGKIPILPAMDWQTVDHAIVTLIQGYFSQIDTGLRTKKIARLDPDIAVDTAQFSLGLTVDSIDSYMLGSYRWVRNDVFPDVTPQDMMCNNNAAIITVFLKGARDQYHSLAFDLLLPLISINNYIRLLDQYKSVVFYGPEGTRKKQLVKRLANQLVEKEKARCDPHIVQIYLHRDYTHNDFVQLLKTEGCLLPVGYTSSMACVLLLFHLEKIQLAAVLGHLLQYIEYRGMHSTFTVPGPDGVPEVCYFPDNFYLIATMDKPRSTGLDLTVQQRFRWVHFRISEEPIRNLLARHFLRRLVHTHNGEALSTDSPVFKAVEWLVCVWQRLNDGVAKLGLPDVVFGPDTFLPCPIESQDHQVLFDWLKRLWNDTISPVIKHAVTRGTGKEGSGEGQHKVANTALYVLMQRAIVPGCPLSGQEKDEYLADFCGSNELDVPMRGDKQSPNGASVIHRRTTQRSDGASGTASPRTLSKHRNSLGAEGTTTSLFVNGNSSVKRRSLSETSLTKTEQIEIPVIHSPGERAKDFQAKVPKLEIRSPVLGLPIPLPNAFSSSGKSNSADSTPVNAERSAHRRSTFSSHSRIPQSTAAKRSRSSENLSVPAGNIRQFRPTSPFSFSLTTPTSSLFSFKFMDDNTTKTSQVNTYQMRSFSETR